MKQNRSYEGLTLRGIACHIVNTILLWEKGKDEKQPPRRPGRFRRRPRYGTPNDCQLMINHLIRSYHDRFEAEEHTVTEYTWQATQAKEEVSLW
jgi:hypothetical protein